MSRRSHRNQGKRRLSPPQVQALEQVERLAAAKSKQPRLGARPDANAFFNSVISWVNRSQDEEPPYLEDSRIRDRWLADFWRREPHLAGVLSSVNSIDSNRGWTLTGGRNQVNRFTDVLRNAEDGAGWRQYISLQSTAYYTADIGALTETGRDGPGGPLRALYHLDSTRCRLTGDRRGPLRYDKSKDPWTEDDFFRLNSMRNILEEYKGLGFCAVSRCLDMSKIMLAVYNHELESLGARSPKGLLLLQNIGEGQWQDAMKARDASLDSDMRKYYNAVAVIAQQGQDSIDAKLIALSQLPDGFDIDTFTDLLMNAYALCFGYDPIEFWPVAAGQLGRGRETDIQHRKGTGKGGMNFMLSFQDQLQLQLPESLLFQFEQRDQEGEMLDAEVAQAWANVAATLYSGGSSADPGPAGAKGGDGEAAKVGQATAPKGSPSAPKEQPESKKTPAANTVKPAPVAQSILTRDEVRSYLAMKGMIPASWTNMDEDVTATDYKDVDVEKRMREELLEDESIRRALYQFPNEPIVRFSWPTGKTQVVFHNAQDALKASRYTVLKPQALIPDFTAPQVEMVVAPDPLPDQQEQPPEPAPTQIRVANGFNIFQGDTKEPLRVTVRDRNKQEVNVSASTQVLYCIFQAGNPTPVLMKELGRGVSVDHAVITVDFDPEDTQDLVGIYSHSVKVFDDLGRPFTVFQGSMAVLKEY